MLEDGIKSILVKFAPFKTIQIRMRYKNWISPETKSEMELRDEARKAAKRTDLEEHWVDIRRRRNIVTARQRQDKKEYLNKMFDKIKTEKDTARLFSTTRNLLGWKKAGPLQFLTSMER